MFRRKNIYTIKFFLRLCIRLISDTVLRLHISLQKKHNYMYIKKIDRLLQDSGKVFVLHATRDI